MKNLLGSLKDKAEKTFVKQTVLLKDGMDKAFPKKQPGATMAEYALILVAILVVVAVGFSNLGKAILAAINSAAGAI